MFCLVLGIFHIIVKCPEHGDLFIFFCLHYIPQETRWRERKRHSSVAREEPWRQLQAGVGCGPLFVSSGWVKAHTPSRLSGLVFLGVACCDDACSAGCLCSGDQQGKKLGCDGV